MQLTRKQWQAQEAHHAQRLGSMLAEHRRRRSAGEKHPVIDFLFEYYRFRPSKLEKWTPGLGVGLADADAEFGSRKHFKSGPGGVEVHVEGVGEDQVTSTRWILHLLEETQNRAPSFGCNGLHEWAMLHGAEPPRHLSTPLRLTQEEISRVVEDQHLICTHFDAFRFFTDSARPLNRATLEGGRVASQEQPGCLHVNMDIYRWAMKRYPWVASDLIADSFMLALEIRGVDMRASPYDLRHLGYEPIMIETQEGRAEYRRLQTDFHRRGIPLRKRLIQAYKNIVDHCENLVVESVDR